MGWQVQIVPFCGGTARYYLKQNQANFNLEAFNMGVIDLWWSKEYPLIIMRVYFSLKNGTRRSSPRISFTGCGYEFMEFHMRLEVFFLQLWAIGTTLGATCKVVMAYLRKGCPSVGKCA